MKAWDEFQFRAKFCKNKLREKSFIPCDWGSNPQKFEVTCFDSFSISKLKFLIFFSVDINITFPLIFFALTIHCNVIKLLFLIYQQINLRSVGATQKPMKERSKNKKNHKIVSQKKCRSRNFIFNFLFILHTVPVTVRRKTFNTQSLATGRRKKERRREESIENRASKLKCWKGIAWKCVRDVYYIAPWCIVVVAVHENEA